MARIDIMGAYGAGTPAIRVGDWARVPLAGFGTFAVTAHKVSGAGALFLFDRCVALRRIDGSGAAECRDRDLQEWLDTSLYEAFPGCLKRRIMGLSVPSASEIFGDGTAAQLPMMVKYANRIAYYGGSCVSIWLRGPEGPGQPPFVLMNCSGSSYSSRVSGVKGGVRPEFWLMKGA